MTTPDDRPPYLAATLVAAGVLGLYVLTIAPTTQMWDTSEYIAAAKVLGIPHPPGNPFFVVLAHVWGMIPLAAHYALRINLLSAVASALASGFLFLVAERYLRAFVPVAGGRIAAAAAGIVVGAASFTVWNQSVVNEKVYTLSLLSIALVLWLAVRWADTPAGHRRDRLLLLMGYLVVLSATNHLMGVLVGPAVLAYMLTTDWREVTRGWVVVFAVMAALAVTNTWTLLVAGDPSRRILVFLLLGAALAYAHWRERDTWRRPLVWIALLAVVAPLALNYAFLPIRAAQFPPINEGEPITWQLLVDVLNREQYQKPPVTHRMADFASQLANYWQYVTWQVGRDWAAWARQALAVGFAGLGVWGGIRQWQRDRRAAWAMTCLYFTLTLLLLYYLNFRYGYSIRPGETLDREVRERDYFFIASFQAWGVWVALGLGDLWARLRGFVRLPDWRGWLATSPLLLVALVPVVGNDASASRSDETLARAFARDILQSVAPYGILITTGDNDMFPLWYAQEVEGIRRDVTLANMSLMNTDWHVRQLARQRVDRFDPAEAAAPWRDLDPPYPDTTALGLTVRQVDALGLVFDRPTPSTFRVGNSLVAHLPAGRYDRATILSLYLIQWNLPRGRPVYFARTTGSTADRLGLTPYMLGTGFVRRVMPAPIAESDSVVAMGGLGWVDLARATTLLFDVYHPEAAARARPRGWLDEPSENILMLYGVAYQAYCAAARALWPDDAAAQARADRAAGIALRVVNQTSLAPVPEPIC